MEIPKDHPRCDNKLIVGFCMECKQPIGEVDKLIMETREKAEYALSHSYCPDCTKLVKQRIKEYKLKNSI